MLDDELAVFSAARQLPEGERAAFLMKSCAKNVKLRRHIEELLEIYNETGTFMETPAAELLKPRKP